MPANIFHPVSSKTNGSITGTSYGIGSGLVFSELTNKTVSYKISAENTLHIYPAISISPETLILPWSPDYTPK